MINKNCSCTRTCSGISIVASIIIGIITGFFEYNATVSIRPIFVWVLFGVSIVWLALLLITLAVGTSKFKACIYWEINKLLFGILGTIFVSAILLTIDFFNAEIIGAIIKGLLLLFFSLTVTSTACKIKCAASFDDEDFDVE